MIGLKTLRRGDHNMIQIQTFNSKTLPILTPPQDTSTVVNVTRYCTSIWLICSTVWIGTHEFLSLKEPGFLSSWVDDTCLTDEQLINGLTYRGKRWLGKMVAWLPEPQTPSWLSLWSLQVHTVQRQPGGRFSEVWRVFCHYCCHFPECFLHISPIVECTSAHETEPKCKKQPMQWEIKLWLFWY